MTTKIDVVDAVCGAGKTTWVFEQMRTQPEKKWLFVSPYLDEAGDGASKGRIQKELPELNFKSPSSTPSKKEDFLRLAKKGNNIAITHKLFTGFSVDIAHVLEEQGYHLVIDETIDLVTFYEDIHHQDVKFLILAGMIKCTQTGQLTWNDEQWPNYTGRDVKIKELCQLGCLWLYGDDVLIQRIPPTCMKACKTVTILTYLFEASLMHSWMKLNDMNWSYLYPEEMKPSAEIKEILRQKLHFVPRSKYITDLQRTSQGLRKSGAFNVGWYKDQDVDSLEKVKKSIEVTLKDQMPKGAVFWTTFKDYENKLAGIGYTRAKKVNGDLRKPFVSKNMRASNEYKDCNNCLYAVNIYPHGSLDNHLRQFDVHLDKDLYALSEVVQFIFRGSIREHNDMYVYILSERMQTLVEEWLLLDY